MKKSVYRSILLLLICFTSTYNSLAQAVYDKIAFSRMETQSDWDIWLMNTDGTQQLKLVNNSYRDGGPCFNPTGTKITFSRVTSTMPMAADIYIMNPDGSGQTNLTNIPSITGPAMSPKFSWDGTQITFDVMNSPGNGDIYRMNADGSSITGVLTDSNDDSSPHFSPDGQWIVFMRQLSMNPNPKAKICKVHISGSPVVDLTNGNHLDETPVFSADGNYILFKRGFTEWDLFLMPANHDPGNDNDLVNMTNTPSSPAGTALYSWEGDKIVFYEALNSSAPSDIYLMDIDGKNKRQVNNDTYIDFDPTLSPSQSTLLSTIPMQFSRINSCSPNPFRNNAVVSFFLAESTKHTIELTDISGKSIFILSDGFLSSGNHFCIIPSGMMTSGVYFCRLITPGRSTQMKIVKTGF